MDDIEVGYQIHIDDSKSLYIISIIVDLKDFNLSSLQSQYEVLRNGFWVWIQKKSFSLRLYPLFLWSLFSWVEKFGWWLVVFQRFAQILKHRIHFFVNFLLS